jgi:hypothetical protein
MNASPAAAAAVPNRFMVRFMMSFPASPAGSIFIRRLAAAWSPPKRLVNGFAVL